MSKHTSLRTAFTLVALLATTACSSISGEISDLRERENELVGQIETLTHERKKTVQLITALQQLQRDDSAKNEADVYEARKALEEAGDNS